MTPNTRMLLISTAYNHVFANLSIHCLNLVRLIFSGLNNANQQNHLCESRTSQNYTVNIVSRDLILRRQGFVMPRVEG